MKFATATLWLGGIGLIGGALSGFVQDGWEGALLGAWVGGVLSAVFGARLDILAYWTKKLVGWDRPVRRPELWGWPLTCASCGWHISPDGPWRVRDCFTPPRSCPDCTGRLFWPPVFCPACGQEPRARLLRWPRNFRQAMWGGNTCETCGCDYDKWNRPVDAEPQNEHPDA